MGQLKELKMAKDPTPLPEDAADLPPGTALDPVTGKPRTFVPAPGSGMDVAQNPPEPDEEEPPPEEPPAA